jgi:hypothetical protein
VKQAANASVRPEADLRSLGTFLAEQLPTDSRFGMGFVLV